MKRLNCYTCDRCNKVISYLKLTTIHGKKRELHYCDNCITIPEINKKLLKGLK